MSEFHVNVVMVRNVQHHPNADRLDTCLAHDYPVITKRGEYRDGDLAVYIPVDAVVPDSPEWAWLKSRRIKAARLRGVFSMGLLVPAPTGAVEGQDMADTMGITRYVPGEEIELGSENIADPGVMPKYTDIEGLRRWKTALNNGGIVVLTEKIHGCNARLVHDGTRLWVGSRTKMKADDAHPWSSAVAADGLAEKLAKIPGVIVFGEVFGQVVGFSYGVVGPHFIAFDAMRPSGEYVDYDEFRDLMEIAGIRTVPLLYRGPWSMALKTHAEGRSMMPGADHIREGFVAKPVRERRDPHNGRVIVKMVGEGYLTR